MLNSNRPIHRRFIRLLASLAIATCVSSLEAQDMRPPVEMLKCNVLILDPDGNPVEDATVYCTGMRTRIEPGSHWSWSPEEHGPLPKLKTNAQGIVEMPYPKYVTEKLETGQMTWSVEHPDFVDFRQDRSVDDDPAEIKLERGYRIAVTAINAATGQKIKDDLYAVISGSRADWKLANNGMLVSPMFAKTETTLRVCQFVDGQPPLFSESIKIEPGDRSRVLLKDVKLSLGTRVEGRLDESVTRPVKNGYVSVGIVRRVNNQNRGWNWHDKAPIEEDGSFVFESLPSDEVLQLIPICDGWVPSKPEQAQLARFFPHRLADLKAWRSLPQLIELKGEVVEPVLKMEKATSVRISVQSPGGEPLSNAKVAMWPNQYWFDSGSQILGTGYSQRELLVKTRAGGYEWDLARPFSGTTDENGSAVIINLPANSTQSIAVEHSGFEMPISGDDRSVRVDLKPDTVNEITIKMQEKGTDSLGEQVEGDADQ